MPECCDAMLAYAYGAAAAGFAATGLELLPGVKELLSRLAERDDVIVALVTGNLERIAWIKMKALGVESSFTKPGIGGFGSDDTERGALVRIARKRCAEKLGAEKVLVQKSGYMARAAPANVADRALINACATLAVECGLKGNSGCIGQDEERGDSLRAIEFPRIKGGKAFDVRVDWFQDLLRQVNSV